VSEKRGTLRLCRRAVGWRAGAFPGRACISTGTLGTEFRGDPKSRAATPLRRIHLYPFTFAVLLESRQSSASLGATGSDSRAGPKEGAEGEPRQGGGRVPFDAKRLLTSRHRTPGAAALHPRALYSSTTHSSWHQPNRPPPAGRHVDRSAVVLRADARGDARHPCRHPSATRTRRAPTQGG
jgi:hypothetical protein